MGQTTHQGRCECGGVTFTVKDAAPKVAICHCSQCRRTSGHIWAATHAPFENVVFSAQETLTWYRSSTWAKRGFCNACGSTLIYCMDGEDSINIAAGCLDTPTGLRVGKHIFTGDKGDYYDIADDAPHIEKY